jgi:hypothetical protein
MKSSMLVTWRYLQDYSRRPINLGLLILVPLIFVALAAGAVADFARIVGGVDDASQLAAPTAGWAAAFLAGIAGFFHVIGSRDADLRLGAAGMGTGRVMVGRLASAGVLALLASSTALGALALRTGIVDPGRVIAGTLMFAFTYLGIGAAVGTVVHNEVNGSLIMIFIWMVDVFQGPAMAGGDAWFTRLFPTHFATLVMLDRPSGHAGPLGDLGWALVWALGTVALAAWTYTAKARTSQSAAHVERGAWTRLSAGLKFGFKDYRRNAAMWVLLVVVPVFFISLSFFVTPDQPAPVELTDGRSVVTRILSMIDVHGAIMVPITIGFLAGLAGMFIVQGSIEADARLVLAGFRTREILASRLGVIAAAALLTTVVALAVTALDFAPKNWAWFAVGNVAVAAIYAMVGVLVGIFFGRLGGLYVMFLVPFIDVGIAQNVMFSAAPPDWGGFLPARGAVSILVDAAFTEGFDQERALLLTVAWLIVLAVANGVAFTRIARPRRT